MNTFRLYTPRENISYQDDLDSARTLGSYTEDFEIESLSGALNTPQYTEDFESTSVKTRSYGKMSRNIARYSGELETIKTSIAETIPEETIQSVDDLEEDTKPVTSGRTSRLTTQYSYDFEEDSLAPGSARTSRLTWQYSEDFEDTERGFLDTDSSESLSTRIHHSSSTSECSDTVTDQHTWADSSELSEGTSEATYLVENNFMTKALERLRQAPHKKTRYQNKKFEIKSDGDVFVAKEASKRKKMFCQRMIKNIQVGKEVKRSENVLPVVGDSVKLHLLGLTPGDFVENHGVSHLAINKLRLENTKAQLDLLIKEHIHKPHKCPNCIVVLEDLARNDFIKDLLHIAHERRIKERLDTATDLSTYLLMEPVVLPGRLQKELSCLSPSMIWNKLGQSDHHPDASEHSNLSHNKPCVLGNELSSSVLHVCPHRVNTEIDPHSKDSLTEDIEQYMQKTQQQVNQVKQDLCNEANRLYKLDCKDFWKEYFSKLR